MLGMYVYKTLSCFMQNLGQLNEYHGCRVLHKMQAKVRCVHPSQPYAKMQAISSPQKNVSGSIACGRNVVYVLFYFLPRFASRKSTCFRTASSSAIIQPPFMRCSIVVEDIFTWEEAKPLSSGGYW
jgi:hypothetical protein